MRSLLIGLLLCSTAYAQEPTGSAFAADNATDRAQELPKLIMPPCTNCATEIAPGSFGSSPALGTTPSVDYLCKNCATIFSLGPSQITVQIRSDDGVVRDGNGTDLADLPLIEQVAKLCAALEGISHTKFIKCGSAP